MKAIGRIHQYFEYKGIKPTRFEKDHGLSNGYLGIQLRRDADIGSSIIELVVNNCRDLNIEWLITGNGDMITNREDNSVEEPICKYTPSPPPCKECKLKDQIIESLNREISTQSQFIHHLQESNSPQAYGQKRKAM